MKKLIIPLLFIILLVGCNKKENSIKTLLLETEKGTIELKYDSNNFEESDYISLKKGKILENEKYRIALEFSDDTKEEVEKTKATYEKVKTRTVKEIEYNKIKGFASIDINTATTEIYLFAGKKQDKIIILRITTNNVENNSSNPEDIIFNQKEIQDILNSIKYKR